jgi:outer membrane protein TolC
LELAVEKARSSKINLRNEVTKAYYNILLAQDSYQVLQDGYTLAEENCVQAKKRFETGIGAEYDYLSAKVQKTNLEPQLLLVENGITQAKLLLKVLMSVDASVNLVTQGKLSDYENRILLNVKQAIDLSNNSDLKQLDLTVLQTEKAVQLQTSKLLPTLAAFGQYTHAGQATKDMDNPLFGGFRPGSEAWFGQGLIVGLQLTIPIFHLSNNTEIKKAKIQSQQVKLQRDYTEHLLSLQAQTALDNMNKAVKQVEVTKNAYTLAQKAYEISTKRYDTGVGILIELQQASVAVTQAGLSHEQAIADYLIAKADYEKLIGQQ